MSTTSQQDTNPGSVQNFLVPSAGKCSEYRVVGQFTASPWLGDWQQISTDAAPFQPQGCYVDNSQSTTAVTLTVTSSGYSFTVPAGCIWHTPFPALNGSKMQVTGSGAGNDVTSITFVDYPVFPIFLDPTAVAGAQNVVITGFTSATPINTLGSPLASGGVPYRVQEYVPQATAYYQSGTGNIAPGVANQNLRKLKITLTGDAILAAAGETTITVQANGVTIFERSIYLPNAIPAAPSQGFTIADEEFGFIGIPMAAGDLNIALSTALTGGKLETNAYFTPQ